MSRTRRGEPLKGWLSALPDCRDRRFIQIGNSLMLSKDFQKLSTGARWLYEAMSMESGGRRDFIFPLSAAKKYGISARSLWRQVDELIGAGWITSQSGATVRQPNKYAFSFEWKAQNK